MKIAVYPGSFDPITNGHLDIIERASKMFDVLIVGVLNNVSKRPMFSLEERVHLIQTSISQNSNIVVESFSGLLIDFMQQKDAEVIIKGLRAVTDFEYELQMASMNKKLAPSIETVFLTAASQYSFLSSSLVKEVAKFNGNIDGLVSDQVKDALKQKLS